MLFLVLLVNTGYVAAFSSPTIFYMTNVLGHVVLGTGLAVLMLLVARRGALKGASLATGLLTLGFVLGALLTYEGNVRDNAWILWAHIGAAIAGVAALVPFVWKKASLWGGGWTTFKKSFAGSLAVLVLLPVVGHGYKRFLPDPNNRIVNPATPPLSMDGEGGGP